MGCRKFLFRAVEGIMILSLAGCHPAAGAPDSVAPAPEMTPIPTIPPTAVPLSQTPLPPTMILQAGNDSPRTLLQNRPSRELQGNRIGGLCHPPWCVREKDQVDIEFFDIGLRGILRITINEIESYSVEDWSASEFHVSQEDDEWVGYLSENITLAYNLSFWDKANHPSGWGEIPSRFTNEEEIQRYLDYVRFVVNHFKDRIHYYEIWNEPDIGYPFQHIEAADYINLAKLTIPVIKEADPEAKIILGGVSGFHNPESQEYLFSLLESDVMPLVDVVSWHPFYGASPEFDDGRDYYYAYPALVQHIKDLASAHGFRGEYLADELTWRTPVNPLEGQPWIYSQPIAARYYARSIVSHLGMDVGVGVMLDPRLDIIRSTVGNLCSLMDGAAPASLPVEIQSPEAQIEDYSFSLPGGEQLIALWVNGVAADEDPGIPSTVIIPGHANWNAAGIDALNGIEQELTAGHENGNLVIHGFMLRDYPIFIRLSE